MKKLLLIFSVMTLSLYAEATTYQTQLNIKKVHHGQTIFRTKLQRKCGFTASYWAQQHTQDEWEELHENGVFKNELVTMCKRNVNNIIQDKWMESLYLFVVEYAKDTGRRPRC